MNPKYFTSLETSIALKEAGVKAFTEVYWARDAELQNNTDWSLVEIVAPNEKAHWVEYVPAYLTDQVLEMLPYQLFGEEFSSQAIKIWRTKKGWTLSYNSGDRKIDIIERGITLVDAASKMLLHLIHNNLITV